MRPRHSLGDDGVPTLDRRTVLAGIGGAVGLGMLSADRVVGQPAASYSVVQGDRCIPVTPLAGEEPVEELYGLRIPLRYEGDNGALRTTEGPFYESTGTVDLQRRDTTITFLYDGPEGLSLVVVHDHVDDDGPDGTGGAVTWRLTGLPADGTWAVKDSYLIDSVTGELATFEGDRWDLGGSSHTIDWAWGKGSTDGGAFRGLEDGFSVTIDPAFNEAAALWGTKNEGRITGWQFLSGDRSSPARESLALDEPITIQAGDCGGSVEVGIDVRPDSDRNPINPKSRGVVPVAIHGGSSVDPDDIDVESLRFGAPTVVDGGGGSEPAHGGHGTDPLIVHFPNGPAGFTDSDTRAKLVGQTLDGTPFVGTDDITIVGGNGNSGSGRDDEKGGRGRRKKDKKKRKRQKKEDKEKRKRRKKKRKRRKKGKKGKQKRGKEGRGHGRGEDDDDDDDDDEEYEDDRDDDEDDD